MGQAQLAVPPRSAHRRLRRHHLTPARSEMTAKTADQAPTPFELGYVMPAEWEPHAATWLAWPHEASDWPGKFAAIPWVFAEVIRQITRGERVRLLVSGKK